MIDSSASMEMRLKHLEQRHRAHSRANLFILAVIALALGLQAGWIYTQGETIDQLIENQAGFLRDTNDTVNYVTALHRALNTHIEEGCISKPAEEKLLKQMDLLIAASRSGWRKAERLVRTQEFREAF